MARDLVSDLVKDARNAGGPRAVLLSDVDGSSIDPCGLRETNFDMMNEVLDGLNNVARHVRPFTLVTWAWRRAIRLAEREGCADFARLEAFVMRCETIFAWSVLSGDRNADIPGNQALAQFLGCPSYRFSGPHWEAFSRVRRYSTAFSAAPNYGPGLKSLGWAFRHATIPSAIVPRPEVSEALDAFEARIADRLDHPAFNTFGEAEVTREEAATWAPAWSLTSLTEAEKAHMRRALTGDLATGSRAAGVSLLLAAASAAGVEDPASPEAVAAARNIAAGELPGFVPPPGLEGTAAAFRRLQVRQLFRLGIEALLAWIVDRLQDGPMGSAQMAVAFLREAGIDPAAPAGSAWLDAVDPALPLSAASSAIEAALRHSRTGLASAIARGLALCLANAPEEPLACDREDRLPLRRAASQARARAMAPALDFARHVIEAWTLGQHVYWAVGRGLQDARGRGKRILRLKVVMEEGGWQALPRARLSPEPTPDRVRTALTLAAEAGLA